MVAGAGLSQPLVDVASARGIGSHNCGEPLTKRDGLRIGAEAPEAGDRDALDMH